MLLLGGENVGSDCELKSVIHYNAVHAKSFVCCLPNVCGPAAMILEFLFKSV